MFINVMNLTLYGKLEEDHWIDEILVWLNDINSFFFDNRGKKRLRPADYKEELYSQGRSSSNGIIFYRSVMGITTRSMRDKTLVSRYTVNDIPRMQIVHDRLYTLISNEIAKPSSEVRWDLISDALYSLANDLPEVNRVG